MGLVGVDFFCQGSMYLVRVYKPKPPAGVDYMCLDSVVYGLLSRYLIIKFPGPFVVEAEFFSCDDIPLSTR